MTFCGLLQVRRDQPHGNDGGKETRHGHQQRVTHDLSETESGDSENWNREEGLNQIGRRISIGVREQYRHDRDIELFTSGDQIRSLDQPLGARW